MNRVRLGVNIDHVATLRQARNEEFPDPVQAALEAEKAGAHGITAHLREDRRHIQERDLFRLKDSLSIPLNMEMAATEPIIRIAEKLRPAWACLVPEKRHELTTEGGLNVAVGRSDLSRCIRRLQAKSIRVSLFIDPSPRAVRVSAELGADAVEFHTGTYSRDFARNGRRSKALKKLVTSAHLARRLGLIVNAGHGLDDTNVATLARQFSFHEFNIGFSIVSKAVFVGMAKAVREMKERMNV